MKDKIVIYCPHSKIHIKKQKSRIMLIIGKDSLYTYCNDVDCVKDRHGTWAKIELSICGKPISFSNVGIKITEMPKGYHFDLDKDKPMVVEAYSE